MLLGYLDELQELEPDLPAADPVVSSPRGSLPFSVLLTAQRWHAGFHLAQLIEFLRRQGTPRVGQLDPRALEGLELPDDVFGGTAD